MQDVVPVAALTRREESGGYLTGIQPSQDLPSWHQIWCGDVKRKRAAENYQYCRRGYGDFAALTSAWKSQRGGDPD